VDWIINDFLTADEIEEVVEYYDQLPYSEEHSGKRNQRKLMHYDLPETPYLKSVFQPKIEKHFPGGYVSSSTFTEWHKPVNIHTDAWQSHEDKSHKLGITLLIPLRITPVEAESSTIIFEQCMPHTFPLTQIAVPGNKLLKDYVSHCDPSIMHKKNNSISNEFYNLHLQHIEDQDMLINLSVDRIHKWTIGDAFYWDRNYFHTSSSFDPKLKTKLHAIFFITFPAARI